ncbi:MAG: DNA/RNA helicase, partial [Psychrosphaera sp.]|nr:DNA/RNA helicase [Psychrosphaera sp.]
MTDTLDTELTNIDIRLQAIDKERFELLQKRKSLVEQREAEFANNFNRYASAEAKVALFLSYFKGRSDVYPTRWENQKGKSGYSPACFEEWVQGICDKRNISCTKCTNQAFKPYNDQTIFDHLNGFHTAGIYPLMPDNTTFLLAADFDKEDWFATICALAKACEALNIPYLLEISRSGNGGHVWLFFEEAIPAMNARKLGMGLLNKAMESYPALSFKCFDRLFPNQDILPKGGFGNLIGLPLQKGPRLQGYSSFIHTDGTRCSDQWAKLASTAKLSVSFVNELLNVLTVDFGSSVDTQKDLKPWENSNANLNKAIG